MGNNQNFRWSRLCNKINIPKTCTNIDTASKSIPKSPSHRLKDMIPPSVAANGQTLNSDITRKSYYVTRDTLVMKEHVEKKPGPRVSLHYLSSSTSTSDAFGCPSHPHSHGSSKGFHLSTSTKSSRMSIQEYSWRPPKVNRETNGKYDGDVVVKSTLDPWRDFMDSMVDMIVENGMKESKELEDLLMRYLSLNSVEYHDVIIAVFKQVWCNHPDIRWA